MNNKAIVTLEANDFRAELAPAIGGNLFALMHKPSSCDILRAPPDLAELRAHACVYGIPVLFPPNRIADGRFQFQGREYQLPVNEPARDNHLHGFLHSRPWQVELALADRVVLTCQNTPDSDWYDCLPHAMAMTLEYQLDAGGLWQRVTVKNLSQLPMPFMLGFHTAFNVGPEDVCRIALGDFCWRMDGTTKLPDGDTEPLGELAACRDTGICPESLAVSAHAPVGAPLDGAVRGAIIERRAAKVRVVYTVGSEFTQWMLWNNSGGHGFFCIEPQTCVVNAPNLAMPDGASGLLVLAPGAAWSSVCRIDVRPFRLERSVMQGEMETVMGDGK